MNLPNMHHNLTNYDANNQRGAGFLLPFLAGALVTAPLYYNRPGYYPPRPHYPYPYPYPSYPYYPYPPF